MPLDINYWKRYYQTHKIRLKETSIKSYYKNKESKQQYYKKNKNRIIAYQKHYQTNYYNKKIKPYTRQKKCIPTTFEKKTIVIRFD